MTRPGEPLSHPSARSRPELWVPALGSWLADLHAGPTAGLAMCSTGVLVDRALARLDAAAREATASEVGGLDLGGLDLGGLDLGGLDRAFRAVPPATLAKQLLASRPGGPHQRCPLAGPNLLDNVMFDGATATSGRAPTHAGDPYLDLGPLAGQLARLVGPEALGAFFESYGATSPDAVRLDFFFLLDAVVG